MKLRPVRYNLHTRPADIHSYTYCTCIYISIYTMSIGSQYTKDSHKILHLTVEETYTKAYLDFTSTYVQGKVFAALKKAQEDNVCKFLLAASENSFFATLRGKMFETHSHEILSQKGLISQAESPCYLTLYALFSMYVNRRDGACTR